MTSDPGAVAKAARERTLSVMLTYKCNAQCSDCGTFSSPMDRSAVPLDSVLRAIVEARDLGFRNVVFTGGEATLRWNDLIAAIRFTREAGLPSRLVTNGHWANNELSAKQGMSELVSAGLGELNVSTGDEHARFIPLEHVVNAVTAGIELGIRTVLMIELRERARIDRNAIEREAQTRTLNVFESSLFSVVESPWMPTDGFQRGGHDPDMAATRKNISARIGCDSVLQTYVVQGNGRLASCCGLGMRRVKELQHGHVSDAVPIGSAVKQAEDDLLKHALRTIGPEKIVAWAAQHDPSIAWEGKYAHRCHACLRLYQDPAIARVLKRHLIELVPDIVFGRYVDEVAIPGAFDGAD